MTHSTTTLAARAPTSGAPAPLSGWPQTILVLAAAYNVIWGLWVVLFPQSFFTLSGMAAPTYPQIWQCLGMVIGLYGIGFFIASRDIVRHWPIVFVGLLGKVLGPMGYLYNLVAGGMPLSGAWMLVTNDLIWWIPFAVILWRVREASLTVPCVQPKDY